MAKRRQPEREIQQQIVRLLKSLGADVWVLGTTRRRGDYQGTMMTAGIPDLYVVMPEHSWITEFGKAPESTRSVATVLPTALWIEVKSPTGRLTAAQKHFQVRCISAGVRHVAGGLDEVYGWLVGNGYLRPDQVSRERSAS
jgi:hypothetical protein